MFTAHLLLVITKFTHILEKKWHFNATIVLFSFSFAGIETGFLSLKYSRNTGNAIVGNLFIHMLKTDKAHYTIIEEMAIGFTSPNDLATLGFINRFHKIHIKWSV